MSFEGKDVVGRRKEVKKRVKMGVRECVEEDLRDQVTNYFKDSNNIFIKGFNSF